jgi:hypothetical protein
MTWFGLEVKWTVTVRGSSRTVLLDMSPSKSVADNTKSKQGRPPPERLSASRNRYAPSPALGSVVQL